MRWVPALVVVICLTMVGVRAGAQSSGPPTYAVTPLFGPQLGDLIPGLDARLTVIVEGPEPVLFTWAGPSYRALRWELPQQASSRFELDREGHLVAAVGPSVLEAGGTLWAGPPVRPVPLAVKVTSARWHATEPGLLAYLVSAEDHTDLWEAWFRDPVSAELRRRGSVPAGTVRIDRFDGQGYLLEVEGDLVRLDPGLQEVGAVPQMLLAGSGPGGDLLLYRYSERGAAFFRSDPQLGDIEPLPWVPATASAAAWSPDDRLAFQVAEAERGWSLQVWGTEGSLETTVPLERRYEMFTWSPDGRFVAAAGGAIGRRQVIGFYDLEDRSLQTITFDDRITAIALSVSG